MEEKINVAEILKGKPEKTILYDAMRDINVSLYVVEKRNGETNIFCDGMEKFKGCSFVYSDTGADSIFRKGMQLLKPSKEMQDWEKFSWKRGDVLESDNKLKRCIFEEWANDDYTDFNCFAMDEGWNDYFSKINNSTSGYHKADDYVTELHIKRVEKKFGGKLNLETLEIEQPKQEFKDGDIVFAKCKDKGTNYLIIYKSITNNRLNDYCSLNMGSNYLDCTGAYCLDLEFYSLHSATNLGKQQLFDALAKEGKRWNPDTKQIEDLPKKYEFKPFDKVMVRDFDDKEWKADFFSHNRLVDDSDYYFSCVGNMWRHCIPYNDETKHLLGTTDEWKGGE